MKSIIKKKKLAELSSIPRMTDQKSMQIMEYLDRLATAAYIGNHPVMSAVIFKMALFSYQNGLCSISPSAYANVGVVFAAMGDFESAATIGEYALQLLKGVSKRVIAKTHFTVAAMCLCWSKPYSYLMTLLKEAYHMGMATGDLESAMFVSY